MQEQIRKAKQKSILWGIIGSALLLSIYFIIVSLSNSVGHALSEFWQLWYWITALVVGFGIQVGLFTHTRQTIQLKKQLKGATSSVAAGAGVSTVSMVACCAHHLSDLLPILGLSAAAVFLTQYQLVFMIVGILSNILGITYMLSIISKHHLYFDDNKWLVRLAGYNYKRIFRIEIPILLIIFLSGTLFFSGNPAASSQVADVQQRVLLENQEVQGNGIWVVIGGEYQRAQGMLIFNIKITTHSGSLDFRLDKISTLKINGRPISLPVTWEGSPPGGHHRSGRLSFNKVPPNASSIALTVSKAGRIGNRKFLWDL
ncbi:hypothetical protein BMS3Abin05_00819 [bacterium BMS3Abin05]|nr:hypothetical protein BMS3Abin05_00819 [bacterium BMS3Abin05]GBE28764.1 hypothetical protein BMS3Bbin03_02715 [bacterium BMS3Bbin03]HDZ12406.1 hypothetical protein [Bacteroidota bacterium]